MTRWLIALSLGLPAHAAVDRARLARLLETQARVKRGAFDETLRLCASYPFARETPSETPSPNFVWLETMGRGLAQPISALVPPGWDRLSKTHPALARARAWQKAARERSLHAHFLVNSPGFARAAALCLGTGDPRAIKSFAFTITAVDLLGSLLTSEALVLQVGLLLNQILKPGIGPAWFARRGIDYVIWSFLPIGAVNLVAYVRRVRAAASAIEAAPIDPTARDERTRLATVAITELRRALDSGDMSRFETWVHQSINLRTLADLHIDAGELSARTDLDARDLIYRRALALILPILDQLLRTPTNVPR